MKSSSVKLDFIGIGAAKCATTWVYRCLLEHPQICGPTKKELNYFLTKKTSIERQNIEHYKFLRKRGLSFYSKYFAHCKSSSVKGEFSTAYMDDPGSAKLINDVFPDVKIIACLRDPVKRAFSHYWFAKEFLGWEKSKTFEKAIKKHGDVYIDKGLYYNKLKPFFELFPYKNIGIFLIDDLKKDPVKFIKSVYNFIGVSCDFIPPSVLTKENTAKKTKIKILRKVTDHIADTSSFFKKMKIYFIVDLLRKIGLENLVFYFNWKINTSDLEKPRMNKSTEIMLRSIFLEDIVRLEKLINRDLSTWKKRTKN